MAKAKQEAKVLMLHPHPHPPNPNAGVLSSIQTEPQEHPRQPRMIGPESRAAVTRFGGSKLAQPMIFVKCERMLILGNKGGGERDKGTSLVDDFLLFHPPQSLADPPSRRQRTLGHEAPKKDTKS